MPSRSPKELDTETILTALGRNPNASQSIGDAFAKLYACYEPRVRYAVARAITRSRYKGSIDDIRQEVWCYFSRPERGVLRYYQPERGQMGAFIQRLAYQRALVAIQHDRSRTRHTALTATFEDDLEDPTIDRAFAAWLQNDYCDKLLEFAEQELDDSDRLLLREVYMRGRSCLAVAREQNINNNTIYKRHERLKSKLREWATRLDPSSTGPGPNSPLVAVLALVLAGLGASASDAHAHHDPDDGSGPTDDR